MEDIIKNTKNQVNETPKYKLGNVEKILALTCAFSAGLTIGLDLTHVEPKYVYTSLGTMLSSGFGAQIKIIYSVNKFKKQNRYNHSSC